jgi:hypothetical protein
VLNRSKRSERARGPGGMTGTNDPTYIVASPRLRLNERRSRPISRETDVPSIAAISLGGLYFGRRPRECGQVSTELISRRTGPGRGES